MNIEIINNIKSLGVDMISNANSGHPGIVLGSAPIMYTLFSKHFNILPKDLNWENRDRFVMSAGHGSALLYATLFMAGILNIEDLKSFRKVGSRTPGHPEYGVTPFVDASTGPLGQGFATAVGMALAEKILNQKTSFPKKNFLEHSRSLIDHHIYVLCSDGDIMEGITSEAASIAGSLKLNNLIVLYDSNNVSLDGKTDITFKEDVLEKFKALGWNTEYVKDGENVNDINNAIIKAKKSSLPTIIEIKTVIGKDSLNEGTNIVHGKVLATSDVEQLKMKLGVPNELFYVNEKARNMFISEINKHSDIKYNEWAINYREFMASNNCSFIFEKEKSYDITKLKYDFGIDKKESTRVLNGKVMNIVASNIDNFIGGSADLFNATKTYLEGLGDINSDNFNGKNIWFGVREHAMGAILNGLSLYNFKVFGSTFLVFSDYMKPAIRMSALMNLPVNYIFTHDSINIGQDGPSHQPVEQLVSLRAIPNVNVFRPCDLKEIIGCWNVMLNSIKTPNALILSRTESDNIETSSIEGVSKGAYIIKKEESTLEGVIIATGTELAMAIHIANDLFQKYKISLRVVSMPCQELFLKQSIAYQESILPPCIKRVVIEASSSYSWYRFVYNDKYLFNVNGFGVSGPKDEVLKYLGFDYDTIENKIYKLFR